MVLSLLFLASWCVAASAEGTCLLDAPSRPKKDVQLRIIRRDWASHRIIAHIAGILLREELQYDVTFVDHDDPVLLPEGDRSSWRDYLWCAQGHIDMSLEVWRSGDKLPYYQEWVLNSSAVHLGNHHALSYIGMYTPTYVIEDEPRAGFTEFLKTPSSQTMFSSVTVPSGSPSADPDGTCGSPEWSCTDYIWRPNYCSHGPNLCRAQVLWGSLYWNQGLIEQRIRNNALNLSVAYLTGDARGRMVWQAVAQHQPVLFYNWEPNNHILGLPATQFKRVKFPPRTNACQQAGSTPAGPAACDDPAAPLQKIVSPKLASEPDARHLIASLQLSSEDYAALFREYEGSDDDPAVAACRWLQQKGRANWGSWVRYTPPVIPFRMTLNTCWMTFWAQLILFVIISILSVRRMLIALCRGEKPRDEQEMAVQAEIESARSLAEVNLGLSPKMAWTNTKLGKTVGDLGETGRVVLGTKTASHEFRSIMKSGKLAFLAFERSESFFIEPSQKTFLYVPNYGQEVFRMQIKSMMFLHLFWYVMHSTMRSTVWRAAQYTLVVGALGTLVHILRENAELNNQEDHWSDNFGEQMTNVISDFKTLPSLFIVFKAMSHIARWSAWLGHAGSIYGRICDLAIIIGALEHTQDVAVRKVQFIFYRYLSMCHVLAFHGLDYRIPAESGKLADVLVSRGLLLKEERERFLEAERAGFSTIVITWISIVWHDHIEASQAEGDNHPNAANFMEKLMALRTAIACVQCHGDYDREPDVTNGMLHLIIYALLALFMITYPFSKYTQWPTQCLQLWSMVSAFLFIFTFHGLLTMQSILAKSPYELGGDCVNVDSNLCWLEEQIFHMLRASYWKIESNGDHIPGLDSLEDGMRTRKGGTKSMEKEEPTTEFSAVVPFHNDHQS